MSLSAWWYEFRIQHIGTEMRRVEEMISAICHLEDDEIAQQQIRIMEARLDGLSAKCSVYHAKLQASLPSTPQAPW